MLEVSPAIRPGLWMRWVLSVLTEYMPHMPIYLSADLSQYCYRNNKLEELLSSDALTYTGKLRVGTAAAMIRMMDQLSTQTAAFNTPVLILHGAADQVTCPRKSAEFHAQCLSPDKTLHIFPNGSHDLVNGDEEQLMQQVNQVIVHWIHSRSI